MQDPSCPLATQEIQDLAVSQERFSNGSIDLKYEKDLVTDVNREWLSKRTVLAIIHTPCASSAQAQAWNAFNHLYYKVHWYSSS